MASGVALAVVVAGASYAGTAHAYNFWGYYWNHMDSVINCNYAGDSTSQQAYTNGLTQWNNVTSQTGLHFSGCNGAADVNLYSANHGETGWDGMTTITNDFAGAACNYGFAWPILQHDKVDLNTYYTNNLNGGKYPYYGDAARQSVTTHELGHVAGLAHAGTNAVMYYSIDRWFVYRIDTPQSDDISGVSWIYHNCPQVR